MAKQKEEEKVPLFLYEHISKIIITPGAPNDFLAQLSKAYPIECEVIASNREWHPNYHALAYQRRHAERSRRG